MHVVAAEYISPCVAHSETCGPRLHWQKSIPLIFIRDNYTIYGISCASAQYIAA